MELQQFCLGSQGRSVHILGNTLFSNYKIKALDLVSKLNTADTDSAEQELCTEHIVAPGQHRDGASGEMTWPACTAHSCPLAHGLFGRIPTRTKPARVYSAHGEELLWEPGLQCLHFCVVLSLLQPCSSWWKDSCCPQHALDQSPLGAVRGSGSVWTLKFLNNVDNSQLKEHIKDRAVFPPFQCSCYSLWQKTPARFSKPLSNLPCFCILLFLE